MFHYAPREHALEQRCAWDPPAPFSRSRDDSHLIVLTSIHWREAWKYGERAFRYCQHDAGHAIGALRIAAALVGWRLTLLPRWSHAAMAALAGVDRDDDFAEAEREEPECVLVATAGDVEPWRGLDPEPIVAAARGGVWSGRANRLSGDRVDWPVIDAVAAITRLKPLRESFKEDSRAIPPTVTPPYPRHLLLQRRSATAFNPRYGLARDAFVDMLARLQPVAPPWDALDWAPQIHLALFVHRVADLAPGIYAYLRDAAAADALRESMRPDFLWEQIAPGVPLYLLLPMDVRALAQRLSCDQEIAGDGFFSLGMLAPLETALAVYGAPFYRRLFWECGLIGQVLYLEAEAAGTRATGIGCFYDDPVHETLGLSGHRWQSLYHLAVGMPIDDERLTIEPGYEWESPLTPAESPA